MGNTVYTEKGWVAEGRAIYSIGEKEPLWTLVAKVSTEVPEREIVGVVELLRCAPETARKLAETQSALSALMEYTIDLAANLLGSQDYFRFCNHATIKAAQEIVAQSSARG